MQFEIVIHGGKRAIVRIIAGDELMLGDEQSALDIIASAHYECNTSRIIIAKKDVDPAFFDLKTRIAGVVLQKFVNYSAALAIIGDFSDCSSKSLRDFMYESNQGSTARFYKTEDEAISWLESVKILGE